MTRWPSAALLLAMVAAALAVQLTPPSGPDAAAALAGWPRLALYAIAGTALALSVPAATRSSSGRNGDARVRSAAASADRRAWLLVALGVVASIAVAGINVEILSRDIDEPLGPPLWVASMLLLLGYTLFPRVRRLGWAAVWPSTADDASTVGPWRWLAPLTLLVLLLVAAALRLPALGDIPLGINADEGDRAATAFDVLAGRGPPGWFDSGWFYINMVYFRLLAFSMLIWSPGVAGGRMLNALAGTAFVATIAWLGCRNFGWRVGLLATALAAGIGITLQHSRFISETGPTALLWAVSIGAFLEGTRSGRPSGWALAGLSGGLSLYFYPSARLWAIGAVLSVVVIWLHRRDRRLLPLFGVAAVGALIASAPYLVHLSQRRDEAALRYLQTTVLDPNNQSRLAYLTPPEPPFELLALQVERTLGLFDRYPDNGGLMPTGHPLFPPPLAALVLVGAAYTLVRSWSDTRLAVLSVWFWLGLSGVAITVETPDYLRAVGMLPVLCFVIALPLIDVLDRAVAVQVDLRPGTRRALQVALPAVVGLSVMASEAAAYFGTFRTMPPSWGASTREGQTVAALGENGPVYSLEMDEHLVNSGWVRLLAPDAERGRVPNPGRELPVVAPAVQVLGADSLRPEMVAATGQGLSVILAADINQDAYLDLLQQLYPSGILTNAGDGRRSFTVSPDGLAGTRGVTLVTQAGATRPVASFGDIPADIGLPAELTWRAGVRFSEPGTFRVAVTSPDHTEVRLDGMSVAAGLADPPLGGEVVAAPGLHFLELVADVSSPTQRPALALGGASADSLHELSPDETYRPMDAPWGLLARVAQLGSAARPFPEPSNAFLDATVAMAFFEPELAFVAAPNTVTWSGTLLAPYPGTYRMAFASEDRMRLEIDGRPADVVSVGPDEWARVGIGSPIQLTAGPHPVRVTLDITHQGRELARWNWVPPTPGGAVDATTEWSVVPPRVLRPDPPVAVVSR